MSAFIFNIAKGRLNEYAIRVDGNDPANSAFIVMLLQDTGLETQAVLEDYDDFAALLAAANTECTVASYARLVWVDTDLAAPVVDDSGNKQDFDVADFDFGLLETGQNISAAVIGYDNDTATGTDANIIPVHCTIPAATVPTNGETFNFRTPSGLWSAA